MPRRAASAASRRPRSATGAGGSWTRARGINRLLVLYRAGDRAAHTSRSPIFRRPGAACAPQSPRVSLIGGSASAVAAELWGNSGKVRGRAGGGGNAAAAQCDRLLRRRRRRSSGRRQGAARYAAAARGHISTYRDPRAIPCGARRCRAVPGTAAQTAPHPPARSVVEIPEPLQPSPAHMPRLSSLH